MTDNTLLTHDTSELSAFDYPGPKFSRKQLEILATEKISSVFGEWYEPLDQYSRVVRMPEPPLLLADRVLGIRGEPGLMGKGTLWTETDVQTNAWYIHQGRMLTGAALEAGQADLLLCSWQGADFHNCGERVYRLLGGEVTCLGELPSPGDTLRFEIQITGHAVHNHVRIFFFQYDCFIKNKLKFKLRSGQAGFFTDQELKNSGGIIWDERSEKIDCSTTISKPLVNCHYKSFTREQLESFAKGDLINCFGQEFVKTQTHHRTPCIPGGKLLFIHEVREFNPEGGFWQRGYMKAVQHIKPNDWFFPCHFKNDPCMPGTLMLEAGIQCMAFYLTALGYTINRDGWRFEPLPDYTCKLKCRGQVNPQSKEVIYEIYVTHVISEPIPILYAILIGTVDGLKSLYTNIAIRLSPDWPVEHRALTLTNYQEKQPVLVLNEFRFDYASLLALAHGNPKHAMGPIYENLPLNRRIPRLPSFPYLCMSRVIKIDCEPRKLAVGATAEFEYDIPSNAWYFEKNAYFSLPFSILSEFGLQCSGWLASYMGSILSCQTDLLFRNLDGKGVLTKEIFPDAVTLRTKVSCVKISKLNNVILETFKIETFSELNCIYMAETVFGFFPETALVNQPGLIIPEDEKNCLNEKSNFQVNLKNYPIKYFFCDLRLPRSNLLMLDQITGFWPHTGKYNKGRLRAEKYIDANSWFFKAHFFQDPVQPGSLGIEAMLQLLRFYLIEKNLQEGLAHPYFQTLLPGKEISWRYRGQVLPENELMTLIIDIVDEGHDGEGVFVIADGSLWIDGKRIYEVKNLSTRVVSDQKTSRNSYKTHSRI